MLPEGYVGPIPGAYTVVTGELPVAEATAQDLQDAAEVALVKLNPAPAYITTGLLEHGGGRLAQDVRWLCTDVWPTLYHVLTIQENDPIRVWGLPKEKAIELLPPGTMPGRAIRVFYQAVQSYYPDEASVEQALGVVESGVDFMRAVKLWWDESHH